MTEVYSLKFDKALFDTAPVRQRAAYLMASQLWNDVNILSRQMLICQTPANSDCSHAEKSARLAAQILNLRFLAGRLHEGQSFYTNLKSALPSWKKDLPDQAVSAISLLNKYFSSNNSTITRLRKKIGFHADFDMFEESLSYIEGPHIEEFIGDTAANTLFMSAEIANLAALPRIIGTQTRREGLNTLIKDCLQAMEWTYDACHGYHQWFLNAYVFPHVSRQNGGSLVDMTGMPAFEDLRFQFFANFDSLASSLEAGQLAKS
jgi:hypothetical protein